MAVRDYQDLFQQASTQLNFLLLIQRNMILVFAFAFAFVGFSTAFQRRILVRTIIFFLLIYSLAIGIVSAIDFLSYMKKTKRELEERDFDDGLELLDDWAGWVDFTYALIALNGLIIIFYFILEMDIYIKNHRKHYSEIEISSSKSSTRHKKKLYKSSKST